MKVSAEELPEPSPAEVAAVDERRQPGARVQLCLSWPACGGPSKCTDCGRHEEEEPGEPARDAEGALTTTEQLVRLLRLVEEIVKALEGGAPFNWTEMQARQFVPALHAAGVVLVTVNSAKRLGHILKARAHPIGRAAFGSPPRVVRYYVLHVQTKKASKPASTKKPGRVSAPEAST